MRSLRITAAEKFEIAEIPRPKPREGDVLVQLTYAAMCNQNDYKFFHNKYRNIAYPMDYGAYGHEGSGTIVEVGTGVKDLAIGDAVALCMEGGPMLYMEYVLRKADSVVKLKKRDDDYLQQAAVLELYGCFQHALSRMPSLSGKTVAVSGLGPAGQIGIQSIKLAEPAELIGIDISTERLEAAKRNGATGTVNSSDPSQLQKIKKEGVDIVVDCSGYPTSILNSFDIANKEVMIFGYTQEKFEVDQSSWFEKELVIRNTARQEVQDLRKAVELFESGKINPRPLISRIMGFEQYDEAVEIIGRKEVIKILLRW